MVEPSLVQKRKQHSRIWWVEVMRGVLSLVFVILLLFFGVDGFGEILGFVFGAYLAVDGVLDIIAIVKGQRTPRRKRMSLFVATLNVLVGCLYMLSPLFALALLVLILAIRMMIQGGVQIWQGLRSRGKYGWWTIPIGLVTFVIGIMLMYDAEISLAVLALFIMVYALCDGIFLITRGILLWRGDREKTVTGSENVSTFAPVKPAQPEDVPETARRAVVFVRRQGASGMGHIGWAFEWHNGWFNVGSVENPTGRSRVGPAQMGFWTAQTLDPITTIQKQFRDYSEYKIFYVAQPQPKDAWHTIVWLSRQTYSVLHRNCCDFTYDVLRAFGVEKTMLRDPGQEFVPNDWYDALPGPSYAIWEHPVIPVSLRQKVRDEPVLKEIHLKIPERIQGVAPEWRVQGHRAWGEITEAWDKMIDDVRAAGARLVSAVLPGSKKESGSRTYS